MTHPALQRFPAGASQFWVPSFWRFTVLFPSVPHGATPATPFAASHLCLICRAVCTLREALLNTATPWHLLWLRLDQVVENTLFLAPNIEIHRIGCHSVSVPQSCPQHGSPFRRDNSTTLLMLEAQHKSGTLPWATSTCTKSLHATTSQVPKVLGPPNCNPKQNN